MSLPSSLLHSTKSVFVLLLLFTSIFIRAEPATSTPLALYNFNAGSGSKVYDVSGNGTPLDLKIRDTGKIHWLQDGGLAVDEPTLIATTGAARKITDAIKASNAFTIEAWIKPASKKQNGPARIITLSADTLNRNLTLGQDKSAYDMRVRTTKTDPNGNPSLHSTQGTLNNTLTHVVYTRSSRGVGKLYINGALQAKKLDQGNLLNWKGGYGFALANEATGDRPWMGEFYQVAIYSQALSEPEIGQSFTYGLDTSSYQASLSPTDSTDSNSTASSSEPASGETTTSSGSTNTTNSIISLDTGSVNLGWGAPVARSNSEALAMNEIAGYTIYYGEAAGDYPNSIIINDAYITSTTITELPLGTYYFVVTVRDTDGRESGHSNITTKRAL